MRAVVAARDIATVAGLDRTGHVTRALRWAGENRDTEQFATSAVRATTAGATQ